MVDFYDREGGLYYKNRYGENCKIHAPKDSIIFIIGETMQILSGGILEAAPHCVVKHRKSKDR
jgi:isopenicillin N synthase-like dioxygenase